ncbi:MAG: tRNA-dihydrouridine synthase [Microgenomates group bacterium]
MWKTLPRPFYVLAPMDDVTDMVFRQVVAECAAPDVYVTEFTNIDGMLSVGAKAVMHRLRTSPLRQKPLVAQLWGTDPDKFYEATKLAVKMGFEGFDINMGCPVKKIIKNDACSGLIGKYERVAAIIAATKKGAGTLPVSVKTRLGIKTIQTEEWIGFLLEQQLDALIIHGRTVAEMSEVPAHWDEIGKAVQLRNKLGSPTLIIGNGDVLSKVDGMQKYTEYGVDGIMIGRGIFKNLYVFDGEKDFATFPRKEKLEHLLKHLTLFHETWGATKHFAIMKKFYKIYVSGFDEASELRMKLMEFNTAQETIDFLHDRVDK